MNTPAVIRLLLKWHARHFVTAAYLALLEREPDEQGLAAYSGNLSRTGDLEEVIRKIARSEEAWNKTVLGSPGPLIAAAFRGLLGRDPEAEALTVYSQELRQTADISALLATVADSAEHWELLLQTRRHASKLLLSDDLPALLAEVVNSPKAWNELAELRFPQGGQAREAYEQDAWIFIHAQKTGGTSLQNMLTDVFGDRIVYREHANTVYRRSPAELARYTIFAGHFDFDSIAHIPRRTLRLFTFLREPRQRLLSQYRFLRAHEPDSPSFGGSKEIANRLDEVEFFRSVMALAGSAFWNHLTWCVMGQRKWNSYRDLLSNPDEHTLARRLGDIRVEIRSRLEEFAFIGLQEDYQHSCQRLFELIGACVPHMRHDHSVESLSANTRYIKHVPRRPLTVQVEEALAPLVQLDDIVYSEGCDLYTQRWGRVTDGNGYRSV